jgi:hypothetical protein
VIGFLNSRSKFKGKTVATPFRQGLRDAGYGEGRNVAVEYRWAEINMTGCRARRGSHHARCRGDRRKRWRLSCGQESDDFNPYHIHHGTRSGRRRIARLSLAMTAPEQFVS